MTTTREETVAREGAVRPPRPSALRLSAAIRVSIAILVAGAITAGAIVAVWTPVPAKTDAIAYPIFADFNGAKYSYAYYLVVVVFPIAAGLIFLGLTRLAPRVGLAAPPSRGRIRPVTSPDEAAPALHPAPSLPTYAAVAAVARVAVVGMVLGLEVGIASNHLWLSILLVTIGYSMAVGLGSVAVWLLTSVQSTWKVRSATVNSLGVPLTVAGLSLVSAHTGVRVLSGNTVHQYSWFPAWLGLPIAAALFVWILAALRGAGPSATATIERRTILLIAVPVALFVLVARLPGDLGQIGLFEQGQSVAETMLLGHGWLPWRDVVLTHGLLVDVAPTALAWGVFGNSYWGAIAGYSVIFYPLVVVLTFWLLAYLVGRSWPLVLIVALLFLGPWLGAVDPRFVLWPLILLLLAALLKRPTRARAAALGCLVVVQAIVIPELVPSVPVVAVVLAAYEWYWRAPGAPWAGAFRRTIWMSLAAVASASAFAIYMASRGALGDVISVTLGLVGGHFNEAIPPASWGVAQARFDFIALAPVAALLISFAYAVTWLRLRRPFLLADWPMAAAALLLLFYYSKFLARMDIFHAYQVFSLATPLIIYIVYRAVSAADRWVRSRLPDRRVRWATFHPVGIAVLVFFLVSFWAPLHTQVTAAPAAYRPSAPAPPAFPRVGYDSQFDGAALEDLGRILNAYLGPHDRVLDLTNEPALFYYFLGRDPSSRWYAPVGIVDTAKLQGNLLADLRRAPPKLVVFDESGELNGLPEMDGVPGPVFLNLITRWVLEHYRPLLDSHGRIIYALPGVRPISSLGLRLHQQPATTGLQFLGQSCNWGYSPTFLTGPAQPPAGAPAVPVRTEVARQPQVTFTGWAGDLRARTPARQVIATFNGRIIGRSTPNADRPDVVSAGYAAGFRRSGFRLTSPTSANASGALRVFAIGRDGSVAELAVPGAPAPRGGTVRIGGRTVALQPGADIGNVDSETSTGALVRIVPPTGSTWSDYRWLELDAPSSASFGQGAFDLSDSLDPNTAGHVIAFQTLASSPRRYFVPVSSCAQWQGYGSRRLFLISLPPQNVGGVRLVR